jgi:hypothetical protein
MSAPDIRATAYAESQIDEAIVAGAISVDKFLHRTFYPWTGTRTFDYAPAQYDSGPWRLWLNDKELASVTAATSGGVSILSALKLRPIIGPPYTHIDLDQATSSTFNYTSGIGQDSISITGLWMGCSLVERSLGTLNGGITSSAAVIRYTPSTRVAGVGHTLRIGAERMLVNGKRWVDSTQTGTLAAQPNANALTVSNGAAFVAGEELMLDAERVQVVVVTGNVLTVRRAVAGSTLGAHTSAAIYWPRDLEVTRGALGTTAATASNGDTVVVHVPPALVSQLNRAYALEAFFQEGTGYARSIGSGESEREFSGRGLRALESRVYDALGRKIRMRAV